MREHVPSCFTQGTCKTQALSHQGCDRRQGTIRVYRLYTEQRHQCLLSVRQRGLQFLKYPSKASVKQIKKTTKYPKRSLILTYKRNSTLKPVSTNDLKYYLHFQCLSYEHIFFHSQEQLLEFFKVHVKHAVSGVTETAL